MAKEAKEAKEVMKQRSKGKIILRLFGSARKINLENS
jgi:hypothetical protein